MRDITIAITVAMALLVTADWETVRLDTLGRFLFGERFRSASCHLANN